MGNDVPLEQTHKSMRHFGFFLHAPWKIQIMTWTHWLQPDTQRQSHTTTRGRSVTRLFSLRGLADAYARSHDLSHFAKKAASQRKKWSNSTILYSFVDWPLYESNFYSHLKLHVDLGRNSFFVLMRQLAVIFPFKGSRHLTPLWGENCFCLPSFLKSKNPCINM